MNASSLGDTRSKKTIPCLNKINSPTIKYTCKESANVNVLLYSLKGFIEINIFSGQIENANMQTKGLYIIGSCFLFRRQLD